MRCVDLQRHQVRFPGRGRHIRTAAFSGSPYWIVTVSAGTPGWRPDPAASATKRAASRGPGRAALVIQRESAASPGMPSTAVAAMEKGQEACAAAGCAASAQRHVGTPAKNRSPHASSDRNCAAGSSRPAPAPPVAEPPSLRWSPAAICPGFVAAPPVTDQVRSRKRLRQIQDVFRRIAVFHGYRYRRRRRPDPGPGR